VTKAIAPIDDVRRTLTQLAPEFKACLPAHVTPEKFVRVAVTAVQNNKQLLDCDRNSLYSSCMKCATDGLVPDGREAALVKFGNTVAYMPMLAGVLKKVRNSGELASIAAQIVYKNDPFKFWVDGDGEHLNHEPLMFGDRGEMIGAYALAKTKHGDVYIEVMPKAEMEKVRSVSRAKNAGPWVDWYDEMAKKTVIRRLSKRLPMSTDLEQVIHRDDDFYDLNQKPEPSAEPKQSRLMDIVNAHQVATTEEPEVI
jgi:recombination protein RecT